MNSDLLLKLNRIRKKDVAALVISIILHLVVGAVLGIAVALVSWIPLIGWLIGALMGLVNLYIFISIVLAVLDYLKVIK